MREWFHIPNLLMGEKPGAETKPLVNDTANDQRYYDVALLPDGEVGLSGWITGKQMVKKDQLFFLQLQMAKMVSRRIDESLLPMLPHRSFCR